MDVLVCRTTCRRHPSDPAEVASRVREAVLDGTISQVTVLADDAAADTGGAARWPGVVEWAAPAGEEHRDRLLTASLRDGTGSVLVFDCACDIRPGILAACANLAVSTVLVTDQQNLPARAAATVRGEGRHVLLERLHGPAGPAGPDLAAQAGAGAAYGFLGALLLTGADRPLLAGLLSSSEDRPADRAARAVRPDRTAPAEAAAPAPAPADRTAFPRWQETISALARRTPVRCAVLTRDVHGDELVVEGRLAGGSHARTSIRLSDGSGRRTLHKEAAGAGLGKLNDELGWLRRLETTAGRHFPDILGYHIAPHAVSMDLAFHRLPTLRDLILTGEIDAEEAARWTRRVLAVLRRDLYPAGRRPAPADYVRRTHLDRIGTRLAQTAAALPERHRLWTADTVVVNGVRLRSAPALVADLARDERALRMLTPDLLVRTHGDPHFDNILVDRHNHRFLLIDPRGNRGYDPAYDLGKVWHSVNSLYDLIHTGRVEVAAGVDGIDYEFTAPHLVAYYRRVRERVHAWLTATGWYQDDPYWFVKVRLAEAAHMCSVMPFHIAHDQRETVALACYARGLELLNDLHRDLDDGGPRPRPRPARADALTGPR